MRGSGAVVTKCEEAYEINEDDFQLVDESLRGQLPHGYFVQWTLSFNPWDSSSWLKARFFDKHSDDVLAMTTTYECNEWLSDEDRKLFEDMKATDPQRYKVAALGCWGVAAGQFFSEWNERKHLVKPFAIPAEWVKFRAMDWGCAKPYCCLWFAVDFDGNLWCYRELYGWGGKANVGTGETAVEVGRKIAMLERPEEKISYGVLDSACWAKTGVPCIAEEINNELYKAKLPTFSKSVKGRVEGANAFKQRLIGNKNSAGEFVPAIKFFTTCLHSARTIPMLAHDKHNPETFDTDAEDHCFIAGTLIHTLRGEIPIETVTTDDEVLTRKGFRKVLASGMTKRNAKVITVFFSDGTTLTGTKNHPIFIKGKGFIALDTVSYGDVVCSASEVKQLCQKNKQKQRIRSYLTALLSDVTPIRKKRRTDVITELTVAFANKVLIICTEKFGNSTMAKSPRAITSTTKMEILSTMTFLIWNCLQKLSTEQNIIREILKPQFVVNVQENLERLNQLQIIWLLSDRKPPSGTVQMRGASGTVNTGLNAPKEKLKSHKSSSFVSNAVRNFLRRITDAITVNSAQELVTQNTGETPGLTTKPEPARFAEKNSELIGSAKQKPAVERAAISVLELREETNCVDVYNLTVDEEHEYFASGILVHNCVDAICYACLSRPFTPTKAVVKRRDAWREETIPSAWAI